MLSDRIVLLTTHAANYYSKADRIVQLEGGSILAQGNFESLKTTLPLTRPDEDAPGINDDRKAVDHDEIWGGTGTGKPVKSVDLEEDEEDRERGSVSFKVYLQYLLYGASPCILLAVPALYFSGAG